MDIEEQLRAFARTLRDQGVSRDEAIRLVSQRRAELERPQAPERPEGGLTGSQKARLLAQGATFGFGEEIEAGARALGALVPGGRSPREAYRESLESAREDIESAYRDYPVRAFATEFAGGVIPAAATLGGSAPLSAASTARTASMAPRALQAARAAGRASAARPIVGGAVEGAISGAGAGEGVGGRALGAGFGAVLGGATGGAFALGGAGVRRGSELLQNVRLQREAAERSAGARAAGIPMSEEEAFSELVSERRPPVATRAAVERVSEALLGQGIEPRRASQFAREGQTVMELGVPVSELRAMEAGMLPGSAAATPIQRVARGVSVGGGEPAERIRSRVAERLIGLPERVKGELTKRVIGERSPYLNVLDDLSEVRKINAGELYNAAYAQSIPATSLRNFISGRTGKADWFNRTYELAREAARLEVAEGVEGATLLPAISRTVQDKSGRVRVEPIPNAQIPIKAADYVQRILEETIEAGRRGVGGATMGATEANALKVGLRNFLNTVDEIVPEFAEARKIYRSDSANLEALNAAYNGGEVFLNDRFVKMKPFLKESTEMIGRFLRSPDISESEKQFYIAGALESLIAKAEGPLAGEGRDLTRVLIGNEADKNRVRLLLGSEQNFRDFLSAMLPERGLKGLEARVLGGSASVEKAQDVARQRGAETLTSLASGAPALAARIFAGALEEAERKFTQATRGRAQRATTAELLSMQPKTFERFLSEVYEPMLTPRARATEIGAEVGRRALGSQLSRILGREF